MCNENLVMLIDWENIDIHCHKNLDGKPVNLEALLQQARCWGDLRHSIAFSGFNDQHGNLVKKLHWNSIEPRFTLTKQSGPVTKNAVDIHLSVAAMSIAYARFEISGFVIVSGDEGFLPLVRELKLMGKRVFLISPNFKSTGKALVQEVDDFKYYDDLIDDRNNSNQ
jgi:uncharacterized LabA/DUF88 family protein